MMYIQRAYTYIIGRYTLLGMFVLILGTACSTPHANIGQPVCKQPIPVTAEIWQDLELMRETLSDNSLIYQECISRLRSRIDLHDK